ncbi:LPS export ABC transporter periplasmic protein LptC [Variovorax sp. VNK109]|jgi:lipopolysaccharide export system protein LptC|uniref:LPS export ABC transporter periplasmic protein LptC n=1 Tax=Variovorax sp. VNK109 TaxID=3400919 RepID=UPI003C0A1656
MSNGLRLVRQTLDRLSIYLPILLMGLLALGTYWLARNAPLPQEPVAQREAKHEPDYFMRRFAVKTFTADGQLRSEVQGTEARHFPDTDTLEIDKVRIRSMSKQGYVTTATADRALTNADGSEVQLFGNAIVVRDATVDAAGKPLPRLEFRGEFLHAFLDTERVKSHKPVTLTRGADQFTANSLDYDNIERMMNLQGRVRGVLMPRAAQR